MTLKELRDEIDRLIWSGLPRDTPVVVYDRHGWFDVDGLDQRKARPAKTAGEWDIVLSADPPGTRTVVTVG